MKEVPPVFQTHPPYEPEYLTVPIPASKFIEIPCPFLPSSLEFDEYKLIKELWMVLDHMQFLCNRLTTNPGLALQQITQVTDHPGSLKVC